MNGEINKTLSPLIIESLESTAKDIDAARKLYPRMNENELRFRIENNELKVKNKGDNKWTTLLIKYGNLKIRLNDNLKNLLGLTKEELEKEVDYIKYINEMKRNVELEKIIREMESNYESVIEEDKAYYEKWIEEVDDN